MRSVAGGTTRGFPAAANRNQPICVASIRLARATSGQEFSHSPHRRSFALPPFFIDNQFNAPILDETQLQLSPIAITPVFPTLISGSKRNHCES